MYAVVRTGGKQHRLSPGEFVNVEKLDVEAGSTVEFPVLFLSTEQGTTVGTPVVPNVAVVCTVVGDGKAKKIIVHKHKRRKGYARKAGHRQPYTRLSVSEIRIG